MNATEMTILWLIVWWAVLLFQLPVMRFAMVKKGKTKFAQDGSDIEGYGQRLTRAIGNCQENIPLFIGLLLFALYTENAAITNSTACWLLYARIGQTLCHLISLKPAFVYARFGFFVVQWLLVLCWVVQLLMV